MKNAVTKNSLYEPALNQVLENFALLYNSKNKNLKK